MKRSEMLDIMWRKLVSESTPNETDMDRCERLLKVAEESGMLPPVTTLMPLNIVDNGWDPE